MPKKLRLFLRFGGMLIIGVALLGNLHGFWPLVVGIAGAVMFFAAGPT